MDPLTITSTVIGVSGRCLRSARALHDLCGKYKDASMTINAIYSETMVLSTSLAHIQALCTKNPEALRSTLNDQPQVEQTFDQALTGCVLVYSVIDDEVQRLYNGMGKEGMSGAISKSKLLWKEEAMRDVLVQIRGQQTALSLLVAVLQTSSIHEIRTLIQGKTAGLQGLAQQTKKFRRANPRINAPSSVFEVAIDDVASLYSVDSTATSTNFLFDDQVINSTAYRRTLQSQSRSDVLPTPLQEQSETSPFTDIAVEVSAEVAKKYIIPLNVRGKLSPGLIASLQNWIDGKVQEQTMKEVEAFEHAAAMNLALKTECAELKKKYFAAQQEKEAQTREHEMRDAAYTRTATEKTEAEEEIILLRDMSIKHQMYFKDIDEKRKSTNEAHLKEMRLLRGNIELGKQKSEELQKELETVRRRAERDKNAAQKNYERVIKSNSEHEKEMSSILEKLKAKETELQHFKSIEPLLEQIRLLSPAPSTSS
ncbi:hypothetical protein EJ04DRAFT_557379 [Polyplosphaeria fusca]|uniref:Uncharacterized protein n=1 Tax=Polyplosphaeria fusca TaxID=682080 RepID=A0A9P4QJH5_9PLEO|nr:hypothetical protein EJ04DRAFT_557379 [Polyplosphaeria fusca]